MCACRHSTFFPDLLAALPLIAEVRASGIAEAYASANPSLTLHL